jgi:hypothetical protein
MAAFETNRAKLSPPAIRTRPTVVHGVFFASLL